MATEEFVPVACDDWYQRRRKDAEGEFFRAVSDQGPRGRVGTDTRQGIYMLTAGGKLLAYKNAGQNAEVMREVLTDALRKWKKLPDGERAPGAVWAVWAGPRSVSTAALVRGESTVRGSSAAVAPGGGESGVRGPSGVSGVFDMRPPGAPRRERRA